MNLYEYALNNPLRYIDPLGTDVWIEGPSGKEPAGHQSINVGNPNGSYNSYSFGVNGNYNLQNGMEGEVYVDTQHGGTIVPGAYNVTTPSQDAAFDNFMKKQVGDKGAYGPTICRNFSQNNFQRAPGTPGTAPSRPGVPPSPPTTGSQSSSTGTIDTSNSSGLSSSSAATTATGNSSQ